MDESEAPQPADLRKRRYRDYVDLAFAVTCPALLVYLAKSEHLRSIALVGLVAISVPYLLFGLRSWNRLLHPGRVPVRWPEDYRRAQRIEELGLFLSLFVIVAITLGIFFDNKNHHLFHYLWYGSIGWNAFLTRYVHDRKYIPPPRDPKGGWAGSIKGIHSEHWGGRATSKAKTSEA